MLITINKSVERDMTQDERWIAKRKEMMDFMEKNIGILHIIVLKKMICSTGLRLIRNL